MKTTLALLVSSAFALVANAQCNQAGLDACIAVADKYETDVCLGRFVQDVSQANTTLYNQCQCYRWNREYQCYPNCDSALANSREAAAKAARDSSCAASGINLNDLLFAAPWDLGSGIVPVDTSNDSPRGNAAAAANGQGDGGFNGGENPLDNSSASVLAIGFGTLVAALVALLS